jgi:hypothetical protein
MAEEKDFLSRWSKRKAEARHAPAEEEAAPEETAQDEDADDQVAALEQEADPEDHPAAGIDIDSLDRNSDYSVFLHEKVPAEIRHRALQKLWLSDPVFANLDGLAEYDLDYTDKSLVVKGLKVAFDEARRRMLQTEAEEKAAAEAQVAQAGDAEPAEAGDDAPEPATAHEDPEDGDLVG